MTCSRSFPLCAALVAALSFTGTACKHAEDPLEPFRKQCTELQTAGSLRAGLSIDDCAKALKTDADANDPAKRAEEYAARIQALSKDAANKSAPNQAAAMDELRAVISEATALGKPAAPVLQAHLNASTDPDLRIAYARALVSICFSDCDQQKYDCIVPALLEGLGQDKPAEVRQISTQGLARCTGKDLGDDPAAWTGWWASVKTPK